MEPRWLISPPRLVPHLFPVLWLRLLSPGGSGQWRPARPLLTLTLLAGLCCFHLPEAPASQHDFLP